MPRVAEPGQGGEHAGGAVELAQCGDRPRGQDRVDIGLRERGTETFRGHGHEALHVGPGLGRAQQPVRLGGCERGRAPHVEVGRVPGGRARRRTPPPARLVSARRPRRCGRRPRRRRAVRTPRRRARCDLHSAPPGTGGGRGCRDPRSRRRRPRSPRTRRSATYGTARGVGRTRRAAAAGTRRPPRSSERRRTCAAGEHRGSARTSRRRAARDEPRAPRCQAIRRAKRACARV